MKDLVNKFLSWPLPPTVCADLCATEPNYPHRTGTTLLSATEAEQMLKHVVGDVLKERDALRAALEKMIEAGRDAYDNGYPEMERAVVEARKALGKD